MRARNYVKGLALALLGSALSTGTGYAQKATSWTQRLTEQALESGYEAKLPPHVSYVLGLVAQADSVPVKQLVSRAGQKVHTFNVSVADHRKVVLFLNDEQAQSAVAYLVSPGGKLRKAVAYQAGSQPAELTGPEARSGLAREKRYWSDYGGVGSAPQRPASPPAPH